MPHRGSPLRPSSSSLAKRGCILLARSSVQVVANWPLSNSINSGTKNNAKDFQKREVSKMDKSLRLEPPRTRQQHATEFLASTEEGSRGYELVCPADACKRSRMACIAGSTSVCWWTIFHPPASR